ncbi:dehydrogenase [Bacillus sp. JCM 19045]|uniref:Dehydrogenase n=1 Tax=Shouchella xiaoxiensis TaxID=766895 RepID=A0ABS2T1T0_9BACI|nr:Gfo/Idh/MocA family oxidoreductase [Shouchella xiaoxiensis]MBM7841211.1 putative dehydrogenase [Shouchella xiaoxiensis]GAF15213.1 dehydrogenase [Bacillus sp. JCM 19045]
MEPVKAGIVGCGNISDIYLQMNERFEAIQIIACTDLNFAQASKQAEKYRGVTAQTMDDFFANEQIEIVINLTIPSAHYVVHKRALEAGKHSYGEKPLALTIEEAIELKELAKAKNVLLGAAPDTFLGGGLQTCKKLIEDGWIGRPVAANGFMMSHGPESWHPNPEFFYKVGAGPLFDMGPYYLTALISILGPIRRLTSSTGKAFEERFATGPANYGEKITVETPTHLSSVLDFHNGVIATLTTSFDVWGSQTPNLEIHGTTGSIQLPDPNTFGGPVFIKRQGAEGFTEVPLIYGFQENSRGLGVLDMAQAILEKREPRASGDLAYHVLEAMHGVLRSSEEGTHYNMESTCQKPDALPLTMTAKGFA